MKLLNQKADEITKSSASLTTHNNTFEIILFLWTVNIRDSYQNMQNLILSNFVNHCQAIIFVNHRNKYKIKKKYFYMAIPL